MARRTKLPHQAEVQSSPSSQDLSGQGGMSPLALRPSLDRGCVRPHQPQALGTGLVGMRGQHGTWLEIRELVLIITVFTLKKILAQ